MGTEQSTDKRTRDLRGELTRFDNGTVLTDSVSVGRTGRAWLLPFEAKLNRKNESPRSSAVHISKQPNEAALVRGTCEFLRQHSPAEYAALYQQLHTHRPVHSEYPEEIRAVREKVKPSRAETFPVTDSVDRIEQRSRKSPCTVRVPMLGPNHWAYKRHFNVGNYCTAKSGDRQTLSEQEANRDSKVIVDYIKKYAVLAESVTDHNLWQATHQPSFRDPYFTCMELCVGEAQVPSHLLSLVHHGIALHMMYELSLPWKKRDIPKSAPPELISALKDAFRVLARLYQEDFCN